MKQSLNRIENYIHEMRYKNIDNILITKNGHDVYSKILIKSLTEKSIALPLL